MNRVVICLLATLFILAIVRCGKRPEPVNQANAQDTSSAISEGAIHKGKELFVQNGCQTCHGPEGRGDGPAGKVLKPSPRDFRALSTYKQGHSAEEIANTLLTGVPGTPMAAYPHISEKDRESIASYVVHLQTQ